MITFETSMGTIKIELDHANTPVTAKNFEDYVKEGFYDGVVFHRVIKDFMIQGGGFEPGMNEKSTKASIDNEADKGGKNMRGSLAMARTMDPHSASAQFFINTKDNAFLNFKSKDANGWGYCVFGNVTEGMDVVDKIQSVKTGNNSGHGDVPVDDVVIEKAYVSE
jgi:peptidyl-prolyl cis-trans isomerase B (cyclophilin B)